MHKSMAAICICLCIGATAHAGFDEYIALFTDLNTQDSIVCLKLMVGSEGKKRLNVVVYNRTNGHRRTEQVTDRSDVIGRLRAYSAQENIPVITQHVPGFKKERTDSGSAKGTSVQKRIPEDSTATNISSVRRNKIRYILSQTAFTGWVYGPAAAMAFNIPQQAGAFSLLSVATGALGHSLFAWDRMFEDAHIAGTNYMSSAAVFTSYMVPGCLLGSSEYDFNLGNQLLLPAYPLALWYGFHYGDRYIDNPGRIHLQSQFALNGIALGGLGCLTLFESVETRNYEVATRLLPMSLLGGAIAGHCFTSLYRPDDVITRGVSSGIMHRTIMGALIGWDLIELGEFERNIALTFLLTTAGGFAQGLYAYRDNYDTFERGVYNTLGMIGGASFIAGIISLNKDMAAPKVSTTLTVGAAISGYALTNFLTRGLERDPAARRVNTQSGHSLSLLPVPSLHQIPESEDASVSLSWRVPGLCLRW